MQNKGEDRPERRRTYRPVLQPVDAAGVDIAEASALAASALKFAALFFPIDAYTITQLSVEVIREVVGGEAARGMTLDRLCSRSSTGRGRVADHFGGDLLSAVEIALRTLHVIDRGRVLYEQLYSHGVRTGKDNQGLGSHHVKNAAATRRFIGLALGGSDRHVSALDIPLTTGTRDDHSSARAEQSRIALFTREMGHRPPGTLREHVDDLLAKQRRVRDCILFPARDHAKGFEGIDGRRPVDFLSLAFSNLFIAGDLPSGPSQKRMRTHEKLLFPPRGRPPGR